MLAGFSQSKFHYVIKIDSITPTHKDAVTWLNGMFGAYPTFNDTTGCFDFYSNFNISQELFTQKALDRNYDILYFLKANIVVVPKEMWEELE